VFLEIHHHKELVKIFDAAYYDHIKGKKTYNSYELLKLHDEAFTLAMDAIAKYPDKVYKNNDRLIAEYPTVFSYNNPDQTLLEEKKETEGLVAKIQNAFKSWMKSKKE